MLKRIKYNVIYELSSQASVAWLKMCRKNRYQQAVRLLAILEV